MNEQNKIYQLTCLFSPLLSSEESDKLVQKIKKEITDREGSFDLPSAFLVKENLTKKRLSYPIKKEQEALFININFTAPAEAIGQIVNQIGSEKDVLRCLATLEKKSKPKPQPDKNEFDFEFVDKVEPLVKKEIEPEKQIEKKEEETTEEEIPDKSSKAKVKIEELDKKLEEILNQ
ncbi:30S ribosomal protein S6 [Patescibacteria group bacterium]|nr:30S ribosomal protein S6 [Patescibacteria group bacterium]